jgi:hypothetical protein
MRETKTGAHVSGMCWTELKFGRHLNGPGLRLPRGDFWLAVPASGAADSTPPLARAHQKLSGDRRHLGPPVGVDPRYWSAPMATAGPDISPGFPRKISGRQASAQLQPRPVSPHASGRSGRLPCVTGMIGIYSYILEMSTSLAAGL